MSSILTSLVLENFIPLLHADTDDRYNGMDTENLAAKVFVDLKKVFGTVGHLILCRKLESYGVLHKELAWLGSYVLNRV